MSSEKARGHYAVGEERRRRILDTAVEHFARWGFHASSLARIANDVDITQGGLLHHFRSKEDLLLSVLERSEQHDIELIFTGPEPTAAEYAAKLVRLVEVNTARPGLVRMFNVLIGESGNPGHPAHGYFKERYDRLVRNSVAVLERAVRNGELRPDVDCRAVSRELMAMMDGLQIQWALDPEALDMAALFRAYMTRTLREIAAG